MDEKLHSRRAVLRISGLGIAGMGGCVLGTGQGSREENEATPDASTTTVTSIATTESTPRRTTTAERTTTEEQSTTEEQTTTEEPPADLCQSVDPTIRSNDPLLVDFNSRKARKCAGRPLDSFENLAVWNVAGGTLSASTDTYFSGSQSARIEARPNSGAMLSRRFDGGVDLSARDLSIAVKLTKSTPEEVSVRLLAPDRANSMVLSRRFRAADWLRLDLGPSEIRGRPDLTNVRELRIEVSSSAAKLRLFVDSIRTTPRPARGSVMLTFDDNYSSQYETAFPIMQQYGFPGVVGVIDSTVGSDSRIPLDGMHEMQAAGWDMVNIHIRPGRASSQNSRPRNGVPNFGRTSSGSSITGSSVEHSS